MRSLALNQEKCTGCSLCELICALIHFGENNPQKAAIHIDRKFPQPGSFEIKVCNQCGRCQEVCPQDAIFEKDGIYKIDPQKCNFCRLCIEECPLHVLFIHENIPYPLKCDLCGECLEVCAPQALSWGE